MKNRLPSPPLPRSRDLRENTLMHSRKYISSRRYYILQNYLILLVIANYDSRSARHKNNNRGLCDLVCQVGGRVLYIYKAWPLRPASYKLSCERFYLFNRVEYISLRRVRIFVKGTPEKHCDTPLYR